MLRQALGDDVNARDAQLSRLEKQPGKTACSVRVLGFDKRNRFRTRTFSREYQASVRTGGALLSDRALVRKAPRVNGLPTQRECLSPRRLHIRTPGQRIPRNGRGTP